MTIAWYVVLAVGSIWLKIDRDATRALRVSPDPAPWVKTLMIVVLAALTVAAVVGPLFLLAKRVQVLADERGLRWSFRGRGVAETFAADNGVAIETNPPPEPARHGHDPDGVDHTGLHGDTYCGGDD